MLILESAIKQLTALGIETQLEDTGSPDWKRLFIKDNGVTIGRINFQNNQYSNFKVYQSFSNSLVQRYIVQRYEYEELRTQVVGLTLKCQSIGRFRRVSAEQKLEPQSISYHLGKAFGIMLSQIKGG